MNRFIRVFVCALLLGLASQPATAELALDLNTGGNASNCVNGCGDVSGRTVGWAFRVIDPIAISGLGVWDNGANGLGFDVPTGLWTATGTLLASATITDVSTPVASASADGNWLFEDIAALILDPGSYVIGSVFLDNGPVARTDPPFVTIPEIAFAGQLDSGAADTGLAFPVTTSLGVPIFGPTMLLAQQVPEPATLALLGIGLAGLGFSRRKRAVS